MIRLVTLASLVTMAFGHGMMHDPPSRNSCWRHDFPGCPKQWTDNELNCGGFSVQWNKNGGKCGVCGDAYHNKSPLYVYPGPYAKGIITRTYKKGQDIEVKVQLTTNHLGRFKFRIGKIGTAPMTEEKLTHVAKTMDGKDWWQVPDRKSRWYTIKLKLPADLTCNHCVLQWYYKTGNSWGSDHEGTGLGYGAQETFVNCADVKIV